jgi:hypothetical protein
LIQGPAEGVKNVLEVNKVKAVVALPDAVHDDE